MVPVDPRREARGHQKFATAQDVAVVLNERLMLNGAGAAPASCQKLGRKAQSQSVKTVLEKVVEFRVISNVWEYLRREFLETSSHFRVIETATTPECVGK